MHKIPVFATIGNAYRFVVRELGTIIRLSWFLLLVATSLQYVAMRASYQHFIDAINGQRELSLTTFTLLQNVGGFPQFVAAAIVAVALHRVILFGDRKSGRIVYLAFGKVEAIFLLLPVLFGASMFVLAFAAVSGGAWLGLEAEPQLSSPLASVAIFVVVLLLTPSLVFLFVRLTLLFPLAVAERRIGLSEAWRLSRGNFWRLLGVFLLGILPLIIVALPVTFFLTPMPIGENADVEQVLRYFEAMRDSLPTATIMNLVAGVFGGALGVGLLCYAFKAVKGYAPGDVLTEPGASG